jgi:altronate dehydratase small subunit
MKPQANIVVLADGDNVGVAVQPIGPGDFARSATGQAITAAEEIPLGHKIALRPIAKEEKIVRLGVPVGIATADIPAGRLVHVHNVRSQYLDNLEDHYE